MDRYTCLYFLGSGYRNTVGLLIYWTGGYISVYNAENKQTELLLYEGEPNTTCVYNAQFTLFNASSFYGHRQAEFWTLCLIAVIILLHIF